MRRLILWVLLGSFVSAGEVIVFEDEDYVVLKPTSEEGEITLTGVILFIGQKAMSMLVDEEITVHGKNYIAYEKVIPRELVQEYGRKRNGDLKGVYELVKIDGLRYAVRPGEGGEKEPQLPPPPSLPPLRLGTKKTETPLLAEPKNLARPVIPKPVAVPVRPPQRRTPAPPGPAPAVTGAPKTAPAPFPVPRPREISEKERKSLTEILKTIQEEGIDSILEDIKKNPNFFRDLELR